MRIYYGPGYSAYYIRRSNVLVQERDTLRTNIVIDQELMREALKLSGAPTKRRIVEDSLRLLVRVKREERIRTAKGKLRWVGDLESMRRNR